MPGIWGTSQGIQVCVPVAGLEPLLPESGLGLIKAGLSETREATKELQQKAVVGRTKAQRIKVSRNSPSYHGWPVEPNHHLGTRDAHVQMRRGRSSLLHGVGEGRRWGSAQGLALA